MEQTGRDRTEQEELYLECREIPSGIEKPNALSPVPLQKLGALGNQHLQTGFASQTPEKANESSHVKRKQEAAELPEKYRRLSELFDRLTCSIRLLTLHKRSPTFQNISVQVARMTGRIRTFQYRHLAQMNHILPEAMKIEKILVLDKKTLYMKPDLKITLVSDIVEIEDLDITSVSDIVEGDLRKSIFVALSDLFASRLKRFFSTHPEVCDIPEAELPDPFNQRSMVIEAASSSGGLSQPIVMDILNSSHLSPSFNRRFSGTDVVRETEKNQSLLSHLPRSPTKLDHLGGQEMGTIRTSDDTCSRLDFTNTAQLARLPSCVGASARESTPLKQFSETDNVTLETPAQPTPKRSIPTCESKSKTMINENSIASGLTVKRSLDFSHLEGEENISNFTAEVSQQNGIVHNGFPEVETEGDPLKDGVAASPKPSFKVSFTLKDGIAASPKPSFKTETDSFTAKHHMICGRGLNEHHQTVTCLSELVSLIHQIFESASCRSITKEELIHKIIMNNCDIDENSDIEGQIQLLEKLVPDWICKKLAPSGDLLYSIKKVSDLNSVLERLISI